MGILCKLGFHADLYFERKKYSEYILGKRIGSGVTFTKRKCHTCGRIQKYDELNGWVNVE